MNLKKVRALAGKTTCKIGRCRTIYRDLNISSMYSTHPYPIIFNNILNIRTASKSLFMYPPDVFRDKV
jgi:hypothetical protein